MNRRKLLHATACAAAGAIAGLRPAFAADAEIEVSPQAAGPSISPHIYGHFIEHLGAVIYDGIWVGRQSKIANLDGVRRQFVDDIGAPNFRWPGGCIADGYHWRDGIGRGARPRTYNCWQDRMPARLDHTETNEFGIRRGARRGAHPSRHDGPQYVRPAGGSEANADAGEHPGRRGGGGHSQTRRRVRRGEAGLRTGDEATGTASYENKPHTRIR